MEFVEILKEIMFENELSQTELAKRLGIKQSQVSEWLKGKSLPGYYNLKILCQELNVSANRLLGLED